MLSLRLGLALAKAHNGVECQHMKTLFPRQDEEVEWVSVMLLYCCCCCCCFFFGGGGGMIMHDNVWNKGSNIWTKVKHMLLQTCIASEAVSIASVSPMNCSQIYKKENNKEKVSHSKRSTLAHQVLRNRVVLFCHTPRAWTKLDFQCFPGNT